MPCHQRPILFDVLSREALLPDSSVAGADRLFVFVPSSCPLMSYTTTSDLMKMTLCSMSTLFKLAGKSALKRAGICNISLVTSLCNGVNHDTRCEISLLGFAERRLPV